MVTAILVGALIWRIGIASLRVFSPDPDEVPAPADPEDDTWPLPGAGNGHVVDGRVLGGHVTP